MFQKKLNLCRTMLIEDLDVSEKFIGQLYQDEVLNGDDRDRILSIDKARQRRKEFLNTLEQIDYKGTSPFPAFLAALSASDQDEVKERLENKQSWTKYVQEQKSKRQEIKLKLQVRKSYLYIVQNIDLQGSTMLDLFIEEGIIDEDDRKIINYYPPARQAREFLSIVESKKHKGKSVYPFLLKALDKSEQNYITEKIKEVEITEEDFQEHESKS